MKNIAYDSLVESCVYEKCGIWTTNNTPRDFIFRNFLRRTKQKKSLCTCACVRCMCVLLKRKTDDRKYHEICSPHDFPTNTEEEILDMDGWVEFFFVGLVVTKCSHFPK